MKVLLVAPLPPPIGGIATGTTNLISYFNSFPDGVTLLLCNSADRFRSITNRSCVVRFYTGVINSIRICLEIIKIVRTEKPVVIHLASSSSIALIKDRLIIIIAKYLKTPVILHWHFGRISSLAIERNLEWRLLCNVINKSILSIVIDDNSYYSLLDAGFTNVVNIPNPIGLDVEQKIMKHNGLKKYEHFGRLLFVGHIVRSKGVYELVEACSQLPEVKELLLIGPYEEGIKNDLLNIANKRGNGKWFILKGPIDKSQVLDYMLESPILALPSYTEGFPNVVIEAMAMGCTIIAADVGAIPQMIDIKGNSPCGICVPAKNVERLKEAILELLTDTVKTELMGKRGIERIFNYYTMGKIVEQYRDVWELASQGDSRIN